MKIKVGIKNRANRGYEILIKSDAFEDVSGFLNRVYPKHSVAIIADSNVWTIYGEKLFKLIQSNRSEPVFSYVFKPGEASKDRKTKSELEDSMFENRHDRQTVIIALGGGVTGDLAGYIAANYMRGLPFVQIPTSLLAQVDSSIGGKTGIDLPYGKNLLGAFWQPARVFIDPRTLLTLPEEEYRSGLGEVIKHALVFSKRLIRILTLKKELVKNRDLDLLKEIIFENCRIKSRVVEKDETEKGLRKLLNFGHTLGHAIELVTDFGISHGEAVLVGMLAELRAGRLANLIRLVDEQTMQSLIKAYIERPEKLAAIPDRELIEAMLLDKKNTSGLIHCALPLSPGRPPARAPWTRVFSPELLAQAFKDVLLEW